MQQSSVIFGALVVAFLVYITMEGHLPQYMTLLGIGQGSSTAASNTSLSSLSLTGLNATGGGSAGIGTTGLTTAQQQTNAINAQMLALGGGAFGNTFNTGHA
jgi:hypothetical protein